MQPLDHDMDELMRKAAADYPVKPQGADWEKVAQQLDALDAGVAVGKTNGLSKKLLLLLPFILASYVCDRFLTYEYGQLKNSETASGFKSIEANTKPSLVKNNAKPITTTPVTSFNKETSVTGQPIREDDVNKKVRIVSGRASELGAMGFSKSYGDAVTKKTATAFFQTMPFYTASAIFGTQTITPYIPQTMIAEKATFVLDHVKQDVKKPKAVTTGKGYVSLLMGPDFSQVKDQRMEKTGYSIGMLAGYNLNRKWSLETGVFWDRKNYYSKGEYFKTDKIKLQPGTKVLRVDGFCAMFEVPLNIRYTIAQKKNTAFTATAGVSSYIMKKEDYDYASWNSFTNDNSYGNAKRKWESKDWFSVANLGIGYEHRIGSQTKIHIEPYVKLPLQGVGIGSLPLRSAGVLIGVTHAIH